MQGKGQNRILFLEEWLRNASTSSTSPPPPVAAVSAQSILQAWADLRDPSLPSLDSDRLVASLRTLDNARSSLHIADPQAKILISLLSANPPLLPLKPLRFIVRLLYFWLRKTPRASHSLVNSVAVQICNILSYQHQCPVSLSTLLLGALVANPALNVSYRRDCLELLCRIMESGQLLEEEEEKEGAAEICAGIGYALYRADEPYFRKVFFFLMTIWNRLSPPASVYYGLMILSLSEWLATVFLNSTSLEKLEIVCGELSAPIWEAMGCAPFAVFMASAGFLRAFRYSVPANSRVSLSPEMRNSVEESIISVARHVISNLDDSKIQSSHLLQCISIGLVRAGAVSFSAPILLVLCITLLKDIFLLKNFCRMAVEIQEGSSVNFTLEKVKGHLDSVAFKEAGAITRVFCDQYVSADEENKGLVENYMWEYALELYTNLRAVALVRHNQLLLGYIEKVAEAAFLMVVVFAAEVSSQKLNSKSCHAIQPEASVRILIAFSCIEFMRRVRLPEYTDAVRRAVLTIRENATLCITFVESMPSYSELINGQGLFALEGTRYVWWEDEVQTARMLFFLRVISTCITLIPVSVLGKLIAPTMFLYLQHPNEKVARASHSVFVSLMSSGKDSDKDERMDLKEKLVFYYTRRSLEAYPGIINFEGLASGVAALVRYLPAGSPAIFFCINCLMGKATILCKAAISESTDMWKAWEGSSETSKKILDLLMRLIYLVDIQVLPYLLKQLSEFILQLPEDGKKVILNELYAQVAESDDVTRKLVLVSWLQSLSYLCSQKVTPISHPKHLIPPSNTPTGQIIQSML